MPPRPRGQVLQRERAQCAPVQGLDMVADCGEHTSNLMVAAFSNRDAGVMRAEALKVRRMEGRGFAAQHETTCSKGIGRVCVNGASSVYLVGLCDVVSGVGETM